MVSFLPKLAGKRWDIEKIYPIISEMGEFLTKKSNARFYHISSTGKLTSGSSVPEVLGMLEGGGYIWLDYSSPTKEDLSTLIEPLGLHPLSVEDCTDENQVPKIENFPRNTFCIFNAFSYREGKLSIQEIDLFIGENYVISVESNAPDNLRIWGKIEREIELHGETVSEGPAFLMHSLLDYVVDHKFEALEALEDELDKAEDTMLLDLPNFSSAILVHLRRDLLMLRKSLFNEREILVKICRRDCPFIPEKALFFYRDIYDHLTKFLELIESSRDIATDLMDMYLSMLNNRMAQASNEMNQTVRRLTFITTVFMPLTLLAGVGGMSEWSMMTGPTNWRISYPVFILIMVLIGIASFYLLKWMERKKSSQS